MSPSMPKIECNLIDCFAANTTRLGRKKKKGFEIKGAYHLELITITTISQTFFHGLAEDSHYFAVRDTVRGNLLRPH